MTRLTWFDIYAEVLGLAALTVCVLVVVAPIIGTAIGWLHDCRERARRYRQHRDRCRLM